MKELGLVGQPGSACATTGSLETEATVLSSMADEYRTNARECEQLAEESINAQLKEEFRRIAQQWRDMADYVENHPRQAAPADRRQF